MRCSALLALALVACTGDPGGGSDASGDGVTPDIRVVLGGSDDEGKGFVDWSNASPTPKIIRGPQGGQHVWVAVRTQGLWPKKMRIDLTMTLIGSGKVVKPGTLPLMPSLQDQAPWSEVVGITAYVKCPCQVFGQDVRVDADAVDLYGLTGHASAIIRPTWDGDCTQKPAGNCNEQ